MANTKGLFVAATTVVVAVGVYFGLNLVRPHVEEKGQMPQTASADQVFSGTIDENSKLEPTAPPPEIGAPLPEQKTETAAASPSAEPAAEAPKPAAAEAPATPAEPAKPAEAEPAKPEAQAAAPAAAPEPAPAPEPKAAAPEPAPAEKMMVPEPAAPKPAPKSAPKHHATAPAVADSRWWGDASKQDPNRLNVTFAGQAAGEKSIAVLFSGTFDKAAGIANVIKVTDAKGKPANGHWEVGPNPKMLLFRAVGAGRYTVTLAPELADSTGKKLGRKLSGPVTVQ